MIEQKKGEKVQPDAARQVPSAISFISLFFSTVSLVVGVGAWAEFLQNDWLGLGYVSFLVGSLLAGLSVFTGDRTVVGRLARALPVVIFVVVVAVLARAFGGDPH